MCLKFGQTSMTINLLLNMTGNATQYAALMAPGLMARWNCIPKKREVFALATIKIDDLAGEIEKELKLYSDHVTEKVKKAVDDISKKAAKEVKDTSPKRTGKYA